MRSDHRNAAGLQSKFPPGLRRGWRVVTCFKLSMMTFFFPQDYVRPQCFVSCPAAPPRRAARRGAPRRAVRRGAPRAAVAGWPPPPWTRPSRPRSPSRRRCCSRACFSARCALSRAPTAQTLTPRVCNTPLTRLRRGRPAVRAMVREGTTGDVSVLPYAMMAAARADLRRDFDGRVRACLRAPSRTRREGTTRRKLGRNDVDSAALSESGRDVPDRRPTSAQVANGTVWLSYGCLLGNATVALRAAAPVGRAPRASDRVSRAART